MDSLNISFRSAGINRSVNLGSSNNRKDFRITESVQAYRNESLRAIQKGGWVDQGAAGAIAKWLSSGDFRLEFYSSKDAGEIRVRVVPSDSHGVTMDMSLQTFISVAPITL